MAETRTVTLPAPVWWALAERAENRGMTITEYLTDMAKGRTVSVATRTRGLSAGVTTEKVRDMHLDGLTDLEIATRLGVTPQAVQYHRRKLRLGPNRVRA